MRRILLIVLFLSIAAAFATARQDTQSTAKQADEEKDLGAMLDAYLNQTEILPQTKTFQDYVEISREKYPGLDFQLVTPADLAAGYKPDKKSKFVDPDLVMLNQIFDSELTGTARPHKSGRLFEVTVPD